MVSPSCPNGRYKRESQMVDFGEIRLTEVHGREVIGADGQGEATRILPFERQALLYAAPSA